jgi:hypothetical protein
VPRKQTQQEFIEKAVSIFGNKYLYHKVIYNGNLGEVVVVCPKHGDFKITPNGHISGKTGCSICSGSRHNTETFIDAAKLVHGDTYIYTKTDFSGIKKEVIIVCKIHGEFSQLADKHINAKHGCQKCDKSCKKDLEYVIKEAKRVHGNRYSYKLSKFITMMFDDIEIVCKIHGSFWQTPSNHIHGKQNCPDCVVAETRLTQREFVQRARKVHGNKYGYKLAKYSDFRVKVEIECKVKNHNTFWQTPASHIQGGAGCPICAKYISECEIAWLNSIKIPKKHRQKSLQINGKRFKVDAYDPITNTVYEFNGDYWHGNPDKYDQDKIHPKRKITYGELYLATLQKEEILKSAGYKVISMWESDWKIMRKFNKMVR